MDKLQEQQMPQLVIQRYGLRKHCVLPEGVDLEEASGQYLHIGSRKTCEAFIRERLALSTARATATPPEPPPAPVEPKQLGQPEQAVAPTPPDTRVYAVTLRHGELDLIRQALDEQARALAGSQGADRLPQLQALSDLGLKLDGLQPRQEQKQPEVPQDPSYPARAPALAEHKPEVQREPELPEHEQYRKELIERARAKYPDATPELATRLDKEINRRVEIVKTYQDHLLEAEREHFPKATAEERAAHLANIRQEVRTFRVAQEAHLQQERERRERKQQQREQMQQAPPAVRARQQQRGYGIER